MTCRTLLALVALILAVKGQGRPVRRDGARVGVDTAAVHATRRWDAYDAGGGRAAEPESLRMEVGMEVAALSAAAAATALACFASTPPPLQVEEVRSLCV